MLTKAEVKKLIKASLAPHGFSQQGNYFRRQVGSTYQALFLQPSYYGGEYFPDMLLTFNELNSERKNTQSDCHMSSRLSSIYHPDGDPTVTPLREWSIRYDDSDTSITQLEEQLQIAIPAFLAWLDEYPSVQVAAEKMRHEKWATAVSRYLLFADLGTEVPMPS